MRRILIFLDVIKLVSEATETLRANNLADCLADICRLAITVGCTMLHRIVCLTPMFLDGTGSIHVTFAILLKVLRRGRRLSLVMQLLPDSKVSVLAVPNAHDCMAR